MAWSLVDSDTFECELDVDTTVTFGASLAENDICAYLLGCDHEIGDGTDECLQTTGYATLYTAIGSATTADIESGWKAMGATPDTTIVFHQGSGGDRDEWPLGVYQVWRGGDGTVDVSVQTDLGTSGNPDPPQLTGITADSLMLIGGTLDDDDVASSVSAPSGFSNLSAHDGVNTPSSNDSTVMMASQTSAGGTVDPAAFSSSGSDDWRSFSISFTASAGGYTITAGQGSYTLTGEASGLYWGREVTAAQGSYALTGEAADFAHGYELIADQDSYILTGQTGGLLWDHILPAEGVSTLAVADILDAQETTSTSGTSKNINLPTSGVNPGDIALVVIALTDGSNPPPTLTINQGWQTFASHVTSNGDQDIRAYVLYKVLDGSEGSSVSFNASGSCGHAAIACAVDNAGPGLFVNLNSGMGYWGDGEATTYTAGSVYAWTGGGLRFALFVSGSGGSMSATPPTGMTDVDSGNVATINSPGNGLDMSLAVKDFAAAGFVGSPFRSGSLEEYLALQFLLFSAPQYITDGISPDLSHGYMITADSDTYTLTGNAIGYFWDHIVAATQGTYNLTGEVTSLLWDHQLVGAQGTYTLTGEVASLLKGWYVGSSQGSYTLTGQDAALLKQLLLSAGQGDYNLTGEIANLLKGWTIVSDQGDYTLTGEQAQILEGLLLAAAQGAYNLTGKDATLSSTGNPSITAELGTYNLTGEAALLLRGFLVTAVQGGYTLNEQDANLLIGHLLNGEQGSYTLDGQTVQLLRSLVVQAAQGTYTFSGQDASLSHGLTITTIAGSYSLSGQAISLLHGWVLAAVYGTYTLTGKSSNLLYSGVTVIVGVKDLTGKHEVEISLTGEHDDIELTGEKVITVDLIGKVLL